MTRYVVSSRSTRPSIRIIPGSGVLEPPSLSYLAADATGLPFVPVALTRSPDK
jgi:hypothetical protein